MIGRLEPFDVGPELNIAAHRQDEGFSRLTRMALHGLGVKSLVQVLNFARLALLAALLDPQDFGLLGIALLVASGLRTFTETGFAAALIQRRDEIRPYFDTYFTVHLIRGLLLAGLLFAAAPLIARFFAAAEAVNVVRVAALILVFEGLSSPGVAAFARELRFGKIYRVELAEAVIGLLIATALAILLRNVWALVISLVLAQAFTAGASYWVAPYRPRLWIDRGRIRDLMRFGREVLGSNILIYILVNGDDLLVGRFLGPVALGLYQVAYRIGNLPATELSRVIAQVGFPALAEVQGDPGSLRRRTRWLLTSSSLLSFPLATAVAFLAPDFVAGVLGARWLPAVPLIQILALFGALRAVNAALGALAYALGKPAIVTRTSAIQLLALALVAWPALQLGGARGIAAAVAAANALALFTLARSVSELLGLRITHLVAPLARTSGLAGLVAAVLAATGFLAGTTGDPLGRFLMQLTVLVTLTGLAAWVGRRSLARWIGTLRHPVL